MGLDNAICIRRNEITNKIPDLCQFAPDWDNKLEYDFEIVYYRKCWNIRNDILYLIGKRFTDEYEFTLTKDDVTAIIKLLKSYNKENFEDNGSCIWDWDDEEWPYAEKIQEDIQKLETLKELMDKYDLDVYFYDSY